MNIVKKTPSASMFRRLKVALVVSSVISLAACSASAPKVNNNFAVPQVPQVEQAKLDKAHAKMVQQSLNKAIDAINRSLNDLAQMQKSQHPDRISMNDDNASYGPALNQMIQMDWYGPVDNIINKLAKQIGFKVQMYGKKPALPILVSIHSVEKQQAAIDILRNLNLQVGQQLDIRVYPEAKVISMRYLS